jgi:hypothetical protein
MSKYNLDQQLASKSEAQVIKMMSVRASKEAEAQEFIDSHEDYRYEDNKKVQTQIKNSYMVIDDCSEWFEAAFPLFSVDLWNELVQSAGSWRNSECYR